MSDTSTGDSEKPMDPPKNDQSNATGPPSASTDRSDETSTPPKNLADMPIHVAGLIIERSDYKRQLILRKVSKTLRALVDRQKPSCKSIRIECCEENVNLIFDDQHVMYTKLMDNDDDDEDDNGIVVLREDFKKAAFDDLASTLKNPKLQLEKFCTSESVFSKKDLEDYYNGIQCVLESLNHQVGVDWRIDSIGMDQIARLEQWRQAEELDIWEPFDKFQMEYATHFKRFEFYEHNFDEEKFIRIIDYLSKLDNFEHCSMYVMDFFASFDSAYELLGTPVSSNTREEVFHHSIPDSSYYLEIKKAKVIIAFEIEKKKREIHC
ncbi:unnamed protein product [Caenorhabditis brenneri]